MQEKSGNPTLSKSALQRVNAINSDAVATVRGTVIKISVLLLLIAGAGSYGWQAAVHQSGLGWLLFAFIGAGISAIVTIFKPTAAPISAPIYALLEGFVLGYISQLFAANYGDIVVQAILITGGIAVSALILYTSGLVKVNEKFKAIVLVATLGVALYYVATLLFGLFHITLPLVYSTSTFGILFSVVVVFIAAMNLLLDYAFIADTAKSDAPKVFEWYGAFSLTVTLVWLYLEVLRLLAKARSN